MGGSSSKNDKETKNNETELNLKEIEKRIREENEEKMKKLKQENEELIRKLKQENEELKKKYLESKKDLIIVGLNNIGATSYMNATLQSLSNTDKLTNFFLSNYESNNSNKIMSNAYYNIIKELWNPENNNKSISPTKFKEILSQENLLFAGNKPNDSKDLINFLIQRLHKELNNNDIQNNNDNYNTQIENQLNEQKMLDIFQKEYKIKYNSIISDLFFGTLEIKSQCQNCKNIKYNFQVFNYIEFPLESVNQYCAKTGKRINYNMDNNKSPDIDLYECFEYYGNLELMTGDNQMYCNICNDSYDFLYCSLLYSTPDYLIINLNRGKGAKDEFNVTYPEQLNLFNFVSCKNKNTIFELYAVICHIGPSNENGHFAAYCRNRIDKKWYLYNDGFVTPCQNLKDCQQGMVYILFYQTLKIYN
jgi:ubiquitin C-terminal hydrolase